MKSNFFKSRKHYMALVVIGLGLSLSFTNCGNVVSIGDVQILDEIAEGLMRPKGTLVNESKRPTQATDNSFTYGDHVYTVKGENDFNSTEHKLPMVGTPSNAASILSDLTLKHLQSVQSRCHLYAVQEHRG